MKSRPDITSHSKAANSTKKMRFRAILVYQFGESDYCVEPETMMASHPEIAWQIAVRRGSLARYGRRFLGLNALELIESLDPTSTACILAGNGSEHVCSKERLPIFLEPRWRDCSINQAELQEALTDPPLVTTVKEIDDVRWSELDHAYGEASDLPESLRQLGSTDTDCRYRALRYLEDSVWHQESLYPATVPVIGILFLFVANPLTPDRDSIAKLLLGISESCCFNPDDYRKSWEQRREWYDPRFLPSMEEVETMIAVALACKNVLNAHRSLLTTLMQDHNESIRTAAREIVEKLS